MRVLVTGGAGFVGSHLVDALLLAGHEVRALDSGEAQAHGGAPPRWLNPAAETVLGDIRDRAAVGRALEGVEIVFHHAAMVGSGQSMHQIHRYVDVNAGGTAVLLEEVLARRQRIGRLVTASSMVVYGDGAYSCAEHGPTPAGDRREEELRAGRWDPRCGRCGLTLQPVATPESWPLRPTSAYGISKRDSEELALRIGGAHGLEVVALRYVNIYGPRQAPANPYTGVATIFCNRLSNGRAPQLFEDGGQLRDPVHVSDVVRANLLAMEVPAAAGLAINIGAGSPLTIMQLARDLATAMDREIEPEVVGGHRTGDIRHCWADLSLAERVLGYRAQADRATEFRRLAQWVLQESPVDRSEQANAELRARGLLR